VSARPTAPCMASHEHACKLATERRRARRTTRSPLDPDPKTLSLGRQRCVTCVHAELCACRPRLHGARLLTGLFARVYGCTMTRGHGNQLAWPFQCTRGQLRPSYRACVQPCLHASLLRNNHAALSGPRRARSPVCTLAALFICMHAAVVGCKPARQNAGNHAN
jgi:hypothetical protein